MKKAIKRFRWSLFLFVSVLSSISYAYCGGLTNEEIYINQKSKSLVSPKGESYTWYFEGKIISLAREVEVKESGSYSVVIADEENNVVEKSIELVVDANGIRKIHIIGDSTVMTYGSDKYPQAGWGQFLQLYFDNSKILVENHAIGGRSSRSFYQEGRWTSVMNVLDSNDFVFIQFGHNDRDWTKEERYTDTTDYKEYLRIYVNDSRSKGAIPVLVSPMIMNAYSGSTLRNVFIENENNYRGAMLHVAQELDVLFIDLNILSYNRINEVGMEYATKFLFFGLEPGEYPNYPDGMSDGTHFQEMGALEMCNLISTGINEWDASDSTSALVDALNPRYQLKVNFENTGSRIASLSGLYPENARITLKTRMSKGNEFIRWLDGEDNLITENVLYQFTMEAQTYTFKPVVSDCFGTEEGTALYDKCGICSGGDTGIDPCTKIFESERSCNYDGKYQKSNDGDITRGVVNTSNNTNPAIEYGILVPSGGSYTFSMMYLGTDINETVSVSVNDEVQLESVKLQNDSHWNATPISLDLFEGTNIIRIESSSSTGGTLFDFLAGYVADLQASCSVDAISDTDFPEANVFPNPFTESININLGLPFDYSILDLTGKVLINGSCESNCSIGENLEQGLYLLHINQQTNTFSGLIEKN